MVLSACTVTVTTGSENMLLVHEALKNGTIVTGYNGNKYSYGEDGVNITVYFNAYNEETITIYGYYSEPTNLEEQQFLTFSFNIIYTIDVANKENMDMNIEREYHDRSGSTWHSTSSKYQLFNLNINEYYINKKFDVTKMNLENNFEAITYLPYYSTKFKNIYKLI